MDRPLGDRAHALHRVVDGAPTNVFGRCDKAGLPVVGDRGDRSARGRRWVHVNVHFARKATELLRCSQMTRSARAQSDLPVLGAMGPTQRYRVPRPGPIRASTIYLSSAASTRGRNGLNGARSKEDRMPVSSARISSSIPCNALASNRPRVANRSDHGSGSARV
jgi:hypothetical protein